MLTIETGLQNAFRIRVGEFTRCLGRQERLQKAISRPSEGGEGCQITWAGLGPPVTAIAMYSLPRRTDSNRFEVIQWPFGVVLAAKDTVLAPRHRFEQHFAMRS